MPQSLTATENNGKVKLSNTVKVLEPIKSSLKITKYLTIDGFSDESAPTGETSAMEFAVYTGEAVEVDGEKVMKYTEVEGTRKSVSFKDIKGNGTYNKEIIFELPEIAADAVTPKTYYVFEVSGNKPVIKGETVNVTIGESEDAYSAVVNYDSDSGIVISATQPDGTASIQNSITKVSMISFSKWSDSGDALTGAVMTLTGAIGENSESNYEYVNDIDNIAEGKYFIKDNVITWVTNGTDFIITGLDGEYTLAEDKAPARYKMMSESVKFTVNNGVIIPDNRITTDEVKILASSVSVSDKEIPEIKPITISKLDMTNGEKELAGATLKITLDAAYYEKLTEEEKTALDEAFSKVVVKQGDATLDDPQLQLSLQRLLTL